MASGFPPIAGILSVLVGGLLASFLGSAKLTIKGPAAGLIVVVLGAVNELGGGDAVSGYRKALAVGFVAAALQILLALLRAGSLGALMSPTVVHGMLSAIGVIIISKQIHVVLGVNAGKGEPLELLMRVPESIMDANPEILAIGATSLVVLVVLNVVKVKFFKFVPAPMVVLAITIPLGLLFDLDHTHKYSLAGHAYEIGPTYLVHLPGSILKATAFPDFSSIASAISVKYIVMFTLIGTIESILSALAVDTLDPEKRPSNLNKDLFGLGIANLLGAFLGALPVISEIVRSKANVDAGAKSPRANFSHAAFLLLFVVAVPGLLSEIPLASLAAILVFVGFRLASPKEFQHAFKLGPDQLAVFLCTLLVTLAVDLLVGVASGFALELLLNALRGATPRRMAKTQVERVDHDGVALVTVRGVAAFPCLVAVQKLLNELSPEIHTVRVDLENTAFVDHTFLSRLHGMANEWPTATLELTGLDTHSSMSQHPLSARKKSVA
jgi:MFS superfamily sulfate permease-like transporter